MHCGSASRSSHAKDSGNFARYLCTECLDRLASTERPHEDYLRSQLQRVAPDLQLATYTSAYVFVPETPIQSLIHNFKYAGMKQLAVRSGSEIAKRTKITPDIIVPVPLHRTRLAERGYNQAEALAKGLSKSLGGKVLTVVRRVRATPSQTRLTVLERKENVRGAFQLARGAERQLQGKDILIVDDVMTTGSTIASVAEAIGKAAPSTISVATLAVARNPE